MAGTDLSFVFEVFKFIFFFTFTLLRPTVVLEAGVAISTVVSMAMLCNKEKKVSEVEVGLKKSVFQAIVPSFSLQSTDPNFFFIFIGE